MRADNSIHLAAAAAARSAGAAERVVAALRDFDRSGAPVSLAKLAAHAQVSRTFLYSRPDLLDALRTLQSSQTGRPDAVPRRQRASEASLLARIEALTGKNAALRQELSTVRRQLAVAHGQLRENRHHPPERSDPQQHEPSGVDLLSAAGRVSR